ncbi:hypothetical protein C5Y96_11060 [Blastopirellula marina]|uniref:CHAT domain-containing protein n=1 Tax=Blastopirellula marina TaxID=124 RepID=A0A2S8FN10_9BACT|nr:MULTISPECIES: CHAT domain-containing tetratricopeptide repeat protein [Pirellulaceae]PQO33380.1 hypothetical protein C5Y96_11060 [Blastopirellula marina]RCS52469.1 CHAT domain-containing protein [Bremerella cremea]
MFHARKRTKLVLLLICATAFAVVPVNLMAGEQEDAAALRNATLQMNAAGKFADAKKLSLKELELNKKLYGDRDIRTAVNYLVLGQIDLGLGDNKSALTNFQQSLKLQRSLKDRSQFNESAYINCVIMEANTLTKLQVLAPAAASFEEALDRQVKMAGDDDLMAAYLRSNLGFVLTKLRRLDEARTHLEKALKVRSEKLGEQHPETLACLTNLASVKVEQGDYQGAKADFEMILNSKLAQPGGATADVALAKNNLGETLNRLGDYAAARQHFQEALVICEKTAGKESELTVTLLNNIGRLERETGELDAATLHLLAALQTSQKVLGAAHDKTAISADNLGQVFQEKQDYPRARSLFDAAFKIRLAVFGAKHPQTAYCMDVLGEFFRHTGNLEEARKYHEEALKIRRESLGDEHSETALSMLHLSHVLASQGEFDTAQRGYEKALEVSRKVNGENHATTGLMVGGLGVLHSLKGEYEESLRYAQLALEIAQNTRGAEHGNATVALMNLGYLHYKLGNYDKAEEFLQEAQEIMTESLPPESYLLVNGQTTLATVFAANGKWEQALDLFDQSQKAKAQSTHVLLASSSSREQEQLRLGLIGSLAKALSVARQHSDQPEVASKSAEWVLNGKSMTTEILAKQTQLTMHSDDPDLRDKIAKLKEVRGTIAAITMASSSPASRASRQSVLQVMTEAENQLSGEIARKQGRNEVTPGWISLNDIRSQLKPNQVFINILQPVTFNLSAKGTEAMGEPERYLAWIIPAENQGEVQLVDLGPSAVINAKITDVRTVIGDTQLLASKKESEATKQCKTALQEVAGLVWQPLKDKLPEATNQLIISPDSTLWLLPWAALPGNEAHYLVEDYQVQYVGSGRELLPKEEKTSTRIPLIFADPDYDLSPADSKAALAKIFRNPAPKSSITDRFAVQTKLPPVGRLPGTKEEAAAVTPSIEKIGGGAPKSFLGEAALEGVVKRVTGPKILLLSTHGFFLPEPKLEPQILARLSSPLKQEYATIQQVDNPLLRCGVLMAGCNNPPVDLDDGILTGMEVIDIDLQGTELVVLSACETGVGDVRTGDGIAGLCQAFQIAGAQRVVSTLWPVSDRETAILMSNFFQQIADGDSHADALRNAQLECIRRHREENSAAHPFYWACWTLIEN